MSSDVLFKFDLKGQEGGTGEISSFDMQFSNCCAHVSNSCVLGGAAKSCLEKTIPEYISPQLTGNPVRATTMILAPNAGAFGQTCLSLPNDKPKPATKQLARMVGR